MITQLLTCALLAGTVVPVTLGNGGNGAWTNRSPMGVSRQEVGAARIAGRVYVVGGLLQPVAASNAVEVYDIASNNWSSIAPLPAARDHAGCAAEGGKLYVAGGYSGNFQPHDELYVFDPQTGNWTQGPDMPFSLGAGWMVSHKGKLYHFGGQAGGFPTAATLVFDPQSNQWTTGAPMPTAREHLNAVSLGDYIFVIGGRGIGLHAVNERYDPVRDEWTTLAPMPTARSAMGMAAYDGRIYAMGGEIPMLHAVSEVYDPATDTWSNDTAMPIPRHGLAAIALDNGILFPGGGTVQGLQPTTAVDFFAPAPFPNKYCTAKVNSCGGTPLIGWSGASSASATSGFTVAVLGATSGKFGLPVYSPTGPAAAPFQGGRLCLAAPGIRRGPAQQSSGGQGGCDATFSLDMNAFAAGLAGGSPAGFLSQAGQRVYVQWWGRDTVANGSFLSDALEYSICP